MKNSQYYIYIPSVNINYKLDHRNADYSFNIDFFTQYAHEVEI